MAGLLHEIAICLSREYLPLGSRLKLLWAFYLVRIKRPFLKNEANGVAFLGFTLFASSYSNLVTILREVFVFGDYYFKSDADAPNIIDCGGNIGLSTLYFKWLYPKARITVFEPSLQNANILNKNIQVNQLEDVDLIQAAVSDKKDTIKFWENVRKPGGSTSVQDVYASKARVVPDDYVEYEVPAKKLSTFIVQPIDLLKMDIEGAEGMVISELAESGALAQIKTIIMEYHHNQQNESNDLPKLLTTLHVNGFKTLIYENELGQSSERLIKQMATHFLLRASRVG